MVASSVQKVAIFSFKLVASMLLCLVSSFPHGLIICLFLSPSPTERSAVRIIRKLRKEDGQEKEKWSHGGNDRHHNQNQKVKEIKKVGREGESHLGGKLECFWPIGDAFQSRCQCFLLSIFRTIDFIMLPFEDCQTSASFLDCLVRQILENLPKREWLSP